MKGFDPIIAADINTSNYLRGNEFDIYQIKVQNDMNSRPANLTETKMENKQM